MKKLIPVLALVAVLAACKTNPAKDNANAVMIDTTGLSDKYDLKAVGNNKFVITEKETAPAPEREVRKSTANNNSNTVYETKTATHSTSNASLPQKDKGWSEAAKGTAIGGGSGAIIGAVVNKNDRVGGAVVGAIIGAGSGYVLGRTQDKKSGRVERAKQSKQGY